MILKKLFKTSALMMTALSLFTVPVIAANNFSMKVDTADDCDSEQISENALKQYSNNYATVTYKDSNITTTDNFQFRVVGQKRR